MKQLLSLFLFLLPCLAWAQYPSNGNQKITLGEQTTADGLIWRGVASDTTLTAKSDTAAYFVLDTVNKKLYFYKASAIPKWNEISGSGGGGVTTFSAGTTGLTPNTATSGAVTLGGTLAVANGGTGASSFSPNNYLIRTNSSGIFDTSLVYEAGGKVGIGTTTLPVKFTVNGGVKSSYYQFNSAVPGTTTDEGFFDYSNGYARFFSVGKTSTPSTKGGFIVILKDANDASVEALLIFPDHSAKFASTIEATTGKFTAVGAGAFSNNLNITSDGTFTTATSDEKFKYNIRPLNYGLETLLQLKPVNFQWIEGEEEDLGFIAQDVAEIIPEAVNTNWNSDLLFRYESLIPILTKAIQEQNALIKALEQRIINLENK